MSLHTFTYGKFSTQYRLVQEKRKTVRLSVLPGGGVVLKCPADYTPGQREKFLKRKWQWLQQQPQP